MERTLESTLLHTLRLRLVQDFPGQIDACLDVLTEEQLWWRPDDHANAAANLVLHLAGSNRYYFDEVIRGRPIARDRDAEFTVRGGVTRDGIRAAWNASVAIVADVMNGLQPSQMMATTDRTGKTTTFAQVLLHVSHHNAIHLGQILWITKMQQPGRLDDIGRKMRAK